MKEFSIKKVANGYIVDLLDIGFMRVSPTRRMAREMREEFLGDPVMNTLTGDDNQDELECNTYVFKTFDEVIAYLKVKMD